MSDSRAADVSLSQSLTTAMSKLPESTIKSLNYFHILFVFPLFFHYIYHKYANY
jgi:hypothetical protein